MSDFDPEKLSVNLIPPANSSRPLVGRKYTLTHSDITAELFLDIGYVYNYQSINLEMRDEVIAEWIRDSQGHFKLVGQAYVDGGEFSQKVADIRFKVFNKEMATALKGMIYGDRAFYEHYPLLLDSPIIIRYASSYPQYRQIAYYGTPRYYLNQTYKRSAVTAI